MTTRASAFQRRVGEPPNVWGHRGARSAKGEEGPTENTLEALLVAAEARAFGVEIDVRVCATGEVVVMHDAALTRVTGGTDERPVVALPRRELDRVRLVGGERVPLLDEALELVRSRDLAINVEMKRDVPDRRAVVQATVDAIGRAGGLVRVIVSSFDPWMLLEFGARAPTIARALLIHESTYQSHALRVARAASALGLDAAHLEKTIATPSTVATLRRAGLVVNVWTVNDPCEAEALDALGADGLITDRPRELLA